MYNQCSKNRCTGLKTASFLNLKNIKSGGGGIFFCFLILMLFFGGCKIKEVPVEEKYETHYIDSVRLKDSVVLIPTERIVDITPWYDTLVLESSVAVSYSWIDTNYRAIQGRMETKQGKLVEVKYVDRWSVKDSIVERDRPIYITETVEVKHIPKWAWITLVWFLVTAALLVFVIYLKIKK